MRSKLFAVIAACCLAAALTVGGAYAQEKRQAWKDYPAEYRISLARAEFEAQCGFVPGKFTGAAAEKAVMNKKFKSSKDLEKDITRYCGREKLKKEVAENRPPASEAPRAPRRYKLLESTPDQLVDRRANRQLVCAGKKPGEWAWHKYPDGRIGAGRC